MSAHRLVASLKVRAKAQVKVRTKALAATGALMLLAALCLQPLLGTHVRAQAASAPPTSVATSTNAATAASAAAANAASAPTVSAAPSGTRRCGWFENPSPGNAWLTDAQGQWLIGVQGGHQAEGDWPRFPTHRWVRRQGSYGHGCACIRVSTDAEGQVLKIHSAASRPLRVCRADKALKAPVVD